MTLPFTKSADNTNMSANNDDIDILARTLWGEARGETVRGIEAVAAVIINRMRVAENNGGKFWWGNSIQSVCRKPYQFSCWNEKDPNRLKLMRVDQRDPVFTICLRIARRAAAGLLKDPTNGATHYHALSVSPAWAEGQVPLCVIGNHEFYKLET